MIDDKVLRDDIAALRALEMIIRADDPYPEGAFVGVGELLKYIVTHTHDDPDARPVLNISGEEIVVSTTAIYTVVINEDGEYVVESHEVLPSTDLINDPDRIFDSAEGDPVCIVSVADCELDQTMRQLVYLDVRDMGIIPNERYNAHAVFPDPEMAESYAAYLNENPNPRDDLVDALLMTLGPVDSD